MARKITPYIVKDVVKVDEDKTILDVAKILVEKHIGSVVVPGSSDKRTSIFTERDMLRAVAQGKDTDTLTLKEVIKEDPATIKPDATASESLALMKEHKCRHLLVMEEDRCVGILSLRDVVQLLIEEKEDLNKFLNNYITGVYPE